MVGWLRCSHNRSTRARLFPVETRWRASQWRRSTEACIAARCFSHRDRGHQENVATSLALETMRASGQHDSWQDAELGKWHYRQVALLTSGTGHVALYVALHVALHVVSHCTHAYHVQEDTWSYGLRMRAMHKQTNYHYQPSTEPD